MRFKVSQTLFFAAATLVLWTPGYSAERPGLLLSPADVEFIRQFRHESPAFSRVLEETATELDLYFETAPDVPEPVDAGGGYSHETHKRNGIAIHDAGIVYQLTGDETDARNAARLLLSYAEMYPGLGNHPQSRGSNPGRLFWQNLNESVWLTYAIQGFDAIQDTLSTAERDRVVSNLLRPMADFLSEGSPGTFDRIHNHGTWAVAAVGMTGYALDDEDYVRKALYGLTGEGDSGFIRQIDLLFSPDGYYSEGPYYQRYAMMPFLLFARSIEANDPELKIFEHREGILLKAIYACVDLSYAGLFFPLNDAIKDKGLDTVELRYGIAMAYALTGDSTLLSIAGLQSSYVLNGDGFRLARARDQGETSPFDYRSRMFRDGPEGRQGALAVLRSGDFSNEQALVLKATSQGMGHGHFDKLGLLFYDNGNEILTDYGAARFLNVEQKNGGRYLPENETWAKQTVAHNTLVVDETSHFSGRLSIAEQSHPEILFFDSTDEVQIASASMEDAYEDTSFNRTVALLDDLATDNPVMIDVLHASSSSEHQYDLPVHFNGHIVDTSHSLEPRISNLRPLGEANGYQHLWLRASTEVPAGENFSVTWLTENRFYTYTVAAQHDMEVFITELGANDPLFNLRREQALVFRVDSASSNWFVSVFEPHGEYNGSEEYTLNSAGLIEDVRFLREGASDVLGIRTGDGSQSILALSLDSDETTSHTVSLEGRPYSWNGFYAFFGEEFAEERELRD
ncbi:MAG: alginate lyase family protein [Gammaproteobacteria bacterium]|nr:alginate lyase family protein [Gammaproteobacteria bacterium]MYH45111.1 alginate lyase family protein [Gammaproteobacteria bacterium]MYL13979.1 alginate lyase family protein [Gammaproteobacteria bacterium]